MAPHGTCSGVWWWNLLGSVGLGIGVVAFAIVVNLVVSAVISRNAKLTESPALEGDAAHLRTDALTSAGVLVALALFKATGAQWLDPAIALVVAASIVITGVRLLTRSSRVLVDEALPAEEIAAIRGAIQEFADWLRVLQFHGQGYQDGNVFHTYGITYVANPYGQSA